MEWWYFGPVVLAVIMFLLVGTLFEERIETAWQQFMEHRRVQLAEMVALDQLSLAENQQVMSCPPTPACHPTTCHPEACHLVVNTCAEPVPAPQSDRPTTLTEVPASKVYGISEQTAAKTPSRKSLRSINSVHRNPSSQSTVVVKS